MVYLSESSEAQWIGFQAHRGRAYFLFEASPRIERYDLTSKLWMTPVTLTSTPTAFRVDDDGIFISLGRKIWRFDLEGDGAQLLAETTEKATDLLIWDQVLFALCAGDRSGSVVSLDKLSGTVIANLVMDNLAFHAASLSPTLGRIYGRQQFVSPDTMRALEVFPDGTIAESHMSLEIFPDATETYVFPSGEMVGDTAGIVYRGTDVGYHTSFGGPVDAIAFTQTGTPVVLRNGTLHAFSEELVETGRYPLHLPEARNLAVNGNEVSVFAVHSGSPSVIVTTVPLTALTPAQPAPVPPFIGLSLVPDGGFVDREETLHLFSRERRALFRWSARDRVYLDGIGLIDPVERVAYSADTHRVYLAADHGRITQIRLTEGTQEQFFAVLPGPAWGLATAGEYVFTCDPSGYWATHNLHHADGRLLTSRTWNHYSQEYVWDPAGRRMYFLRDEVEPNDLHFEEILSDGQFGTGGETPYHGEFLVAHPIRVRPDGGTLLLGNGDLYDASTLERVGSLGVSLVDAVWVDSTLFTLHGGSNTTEVVKWSEAAVVSGRFGLGGKPFGLWVLPGKLLAVTVEDEQPRMTLLSDSLQVLYQSPYYLVPTRIQLDPTNIVSTLAPGQVAGVFSVLGVDPISAYHFELLDDADGRFRIDGHRLVLEAQLTPYTTHRVVVRVTDSSGLSAERTIDVNVIEDLPTPPLGEVVLTFEKKSSAPNETVIREDQGFWVESPEQFEIVGTGDSPSPHNGTGYLRVRQPGQWLKIRHRSGQTFRLYSLRLATLPGNKCTSVGVVANSIHGNMVGFGAWLHGAVDGPSGIEDFQTFQMAEYFADLLDVTLTGEGFALDDMAVFVGPQPAVPLVRLQVFDVGAFEDPGLEMHGEPHLHTARFDVTRTGDLSQPLTCELSIGGTALYGVDYTVTGAGYSSGQVKFNPWQTSAHLYVFPAKDSVPDDRETVQVRLQPGSGYALSGPSETTITIFENAYDAWVVDRWWGLDRSSPFAEPTADPEKDGYNNLVEFVLGMSPFEPGLMSKPRVWSQGQSILLRLPRSMLARNYRYQLRSSKDWASWTPFNIVPQVLDWSASLEMLQYEVPNDGGKVIIDIGLAAE